MQILIGQVCAWPSGCISNKHPGDAELSSLRTALGAAQPWTTGFQTRFLGFPEDAAGPGLGVMGTFG